MAINNISMTIQQMANACGSGTRYLNDWINTDDQPYRSISNNTHTSQGCCVSNPYDFATKNDTKAVPSIGIESSPLKSYDGWSYRKLSDLIKTFGDIPIRSMTMNSSSINCTHVISIECDYHPLQVSLPPEDINKSTTKENEKENNKMINNNMNNNSMFDAFKGMFGKVDNGMCRLSMNGNIAVKTSNGYKSYNMKEGRLVNCANFVFPMGDEMFFIIPTNKVEKGDIIVVAGLPKCVLKKDDGTITVINYEDSTVETILPERHIFMGETYFYGKIVSMFGEDIIGGGKKSMNKIMKFMMMSEMMKGFGGNSQNNAMANMMPLRMMSGGNMGDLFSGIFDFGEKDETEHVDGETDKFPDSKD